MFNTLRMKYHPCNGCPQAAGGCQFRGACTAFAAHERRMLDIAYPARLARHNEIDAEKSARFAHRDVAERKAMKNPLRAAYVR